MRIMTEKVAQQLVKLLADNRIHPDQWRLWIPQNITEENIHIIANAHQLSVGILESIEENDIGLPAHLVLEYPVRDKE